ncbi:MAG: Uncharacterized protein G01um101420_853 [Parcubacteria group bacterium Gr01-1014_20]|nr:MAG: Uncharacterized protein G01um101420_853 [Parcubacteria group bacterium Gr01-1014_20]
MDKVFIKNRNGVKLAIVVEQTPNQKGLAFVMYGQGGFKEDLNVRTFTEAFLGKEYTVITFDTTNTIGESGGKMEDATITSYYQDLEDVIEWSKSQEWYQEPFVLAGHSLGGICIALFAQKYPEKVRALAPISTVVSGKLTWETMPKEELEEFRRKGYIVTPSISKPGVMKKLSWASMEDRLKYDLIPEAGKLIMPVLMIVGEKDTSTPLRHEELLYGKLPGKKEIHVIKGAPHTFRDPEHLKEIKQVFLNWIDKI